jgi:hypothetical protein
MTKYTNEQGFFVRKGEQIGGGFFVFRRGTMANRIKPSERPFEHPSMESAIAERDRLNEANPHLKYAVFAEVK